MMAIALGGGRERELPPVDDRGREADQAGRTGVVAGRIRRRVILAAAGGGDRQTQPRTHARAAGEDRMPHGLGQTRRTAGDGPGVYGSGQCLLDSRSGTHQGAPGKPRSVVNM